jgi:hypothetical protein
MKSAMGVRIQLREQPDDPARPRTDRVGSIHERQS